MLMYAFPVNPSSAALTLSQVLASPAVSEPSSTLRRTLGSGAALHCCCAALGLVAQGCTVAGRLPQFALLHHASFSGSTHAAVVIHAGGYFPG